MSSLPPWQGTWYFAQGKTRNALEFTSASATKVHFTLYMSAGMNAGEIEGGARRLSATTAEYKASGCRLLFTVTATGLQVKTLGACDVGMNVDASGLYTRTKPPEEPLKDSYFLLEAGLVGTRAVEDVLRRSQHYERYEEIAHRITDESAKCPPFVVRSGTFLKNDNCIVASLGDKVWAAAVDTKPDGSGLVIYLSTNVGPEVAVPACVQQWLARFPTIPVTKELIK